jgi:hypothetical protein
MPKTATELVKMSFGRVFRAWALSMMALVASKLT